MLLKKLLLIFSSLLFGFGGSKVSVQVRKTPVVVAPSMDELLAYDCAHAVSSLLDLSVQEGPIFSGGDLIFSSYETADARRILVVNAGAGAGFYSVKLDGAGTNRLRFELPDGFSGSRKTYFLSYAHGGSLRSRVFEFSEERAPSGRDELDYPLVQVIRSSNVITLVEYSTYQTAHGILDALNSGRIPHNEISSRRPHNCDHLQRRNPALARNLQYSLDSVEAVVFGQAPSGLAMTSVPEDVGGGGVSDRDGIGGRRPASFGN